MIWQKQTDVASTNEVPRRPKRRHWLQYGLRTFLVVVTLLCIAVGTLAVKARRQRQLTAAVTSVGGELRFDWQPSYADRVAQFEQWRRAMRSGTPPKDPEHPEGPTWLRTTLGDEYFQEIEEVKLSSPRWSRFEGGKKRLLHLVANSPHLTELYISRSDLNDDDLTVLSRLDSLRRLSISQSEISDDGLPLLYGMKNLESLVVTGPNMTFEGVVELSARLPKCHVTGPIEEIHLLAGELRGELGVFVFPNTVTMEPFTK
ncbi:hypothetical protein [Aeoliella sp.]|uniref:hypothetical protein n=1 Tax=Aeoliella sp. TaxID=2795800 RepID=UPI003CCBBCD0